VNEVSEVSEVSEAFKCVPVQFCYRGFVIRV
jgi:hypothetical protein